MARLVVKMVVLLKVLKLDLLLLLQMLKLLMLLHLKQLLLLLKRGQALGSLGALLVMTLLSSLAGTEDTHQVSILGVGLFRCASSVQIP